MKLRILITAVLAAIGLLAWAVCVLCGKWRTRRKRRKAWKEYLRLTEDWDTDDASPEEAVAATKAARREIAEERRRAAKSKPTNKGGQQAAATGADSPAEGETQ